MAELLRSLFLCFNLKSFKDPNSLSFIRFHCILHDLVVLFSLLKFLQIKEGAPNFLGGTILQNGGIIRSTLLYFNFKSFKNPNSSSFIRFHCILHDSGEPFSDFSSFYKLKRGGGGLISWGEAILQNGWIIWSTLLYFNFKSFKDPNSLSFITF